MNLRTPIVPILILFTSSGFFCEPKETAPPPEPVQQPKDYSAAIQRDYASLADSIKQDETELRMNEAEFEDWAAGLPKKKATGALYESVLERKAFFDERAARIRSGVEASAKLYEESKTRQPGPDEAREFYWSFELFLLEGPRLGDGYNRLETDMHHIHEG